MKKLLILLVSVTLFISCKNDNKSKDAETIEASTMLKGDFVYFDGAAVLQTHSEIYGVLLTRKIRQLFRLFIIMRVNFVRD